MRRTCGDSHGCPAASGRNQSSRSYDQRGLRRGTMPKRETDSVAEKVIVPILTYTEMKLVEAQVLRGVDLVMWLTEYGPGTGEGFALVRGLGVERGTSPSARWRGSTARAASASSSGTSSSSRRARAGLRGGCGDADRRVRDGLWRAGDARRVLRPLRRGRSGLEDVDCKTRETSHVAERRRRASGARGIILPLLSLGGRRAARLTRSHHGQPIRSGHPRRARQLFPGFSGVPASSAHLFSGNAL